MIELRSRAKQGFGQDYSEKKLCGDNNLAIDFYSPDEATAVELAGMLGAPNSEYEKDIFKCLPPKTQQFSSRCRSQEGPPITERCDDGHDNLSTKVRQNTVIPY